MLYMLERASARNAHCFPSASSRRPRCARKPSGAGCAPRRRPESMDVCFITRGGRSEFLAERNARRPGEIVDVDGEHLGVHDDTARFTIGQRRGTGVAAGERRFVVDIDAATATVTLGRRDDLLRDARRARRSRARDGRRRTELFSAQTRAHGEPVAAIVDVARKTDARPVSFATPQPRVAPGQVVALVRRRSRARRRSWPVRGRKTRLRRRVMRCAPAARSTDAPRPHAGRP